MLTPFLLTADPAQRGHRQLFCSTKSSFLTVIQRQPGRDAELNHTRPVYTGFYGPKDDVLMVHFELTPSQPDATLELWPDELLLEAIRYYNAQAGFSDLMMVHQYRPIRVLFESEHSLLKQVSAPPAHLVDHLILDQGHFEYLD